MRRTPLNLKWLEKINEQFMLSEQEEPTLSIEQRKLKVIKKILGDYINKKKSYGFFNKELKQNLQMDIDAVLKNEIERIEKELNQPQSSFKLQALINKINALRNFPDKHDVRSFLITLYVCTDRYRGHLSKNKYVSLNKETHTNEQKQLAEKNENEYIGLDKLLGKNNENNESDYAKLTTSDELENKENAKYTLKSDEISSPFKDDVFFYVPMKEWIASMLDANLMLHFYANEAKALDDFGYVPIPGECLNGKSDLIPKSLSNNDEFSAKREIVNRPHQELLSGLIEPSLIEQYKNLTKKKHK